MEKRRLGRGLDALIGSSEGTTATVAAESHRVAVGQIESNPHQPRKAFDQEELNALSASIKTHGVLQPLVVRRVGEKFQLIAGERRLRAAQAAGFAEVPVQVVDFNDQQVLEAALIENIQRADLNPIEKALGFQDYLKRFSMTHEQLAGRLGMDRSTITNLVRLLDLPTEVQDAVRVGQISGGHARTLLALNDKERQVALCKEIIACGHSVRTTEALVKQPAKPDASGGEKPESTKTAPEKTQHVLSIEDELRKSLSTRVEIKLKSKEKGQIVLGFDTNDDFERILEVLRKAA